MLKDKLVANELAELSRDDELVRLRNEVRRLREQQQAIQNNLRAIMIIDRGPEPASLRHLDTMQIVRSMLVKEEEGEPIRARDLS